MSSESETEQSVMDAESEEGQSEKSASEEEQSNESESETVESEDESGDQEEDKENGTESDSKIKEKDSNQKTRDANFTDSALEWSINLYGKCLQVSTSCKTNIIKEETIRKHCPLALKVHTIGKFGSDCLVEFENSEIRLKAIKELQNVKFEDEPMFIDIPKWEDPKESAMRLLRKAMREIRIRKALLRNNPRNYGMSNRYQPTFNKVNNPRTNTVCVSNIPAHSSISEIEKVFPNAIDIKLSFQKSKTTATAVVNLPTFEDVMETTNKHFQIGENRLVIQTPSNQHGIFQKKFKREDHSNVQLSLPKKEKVVSKEIISTELEKTNLKPIKKEASKKRVDLKEHKADKKHSKKEVKKIASIEKIRNKKVKTEKQLKVKKPKVK